MIDIGMQGRVSARWWQELSAKYGQRTSLLAQHTLSKGDLQVRDELTEALSVMMDEDNKVRSNDTFNAFLSYCEPLNEKDTGFLWVSMFVA